MELPVRPQSHALQLTLKIKAFRLKADLQLELSQDQDRAPFPALTSGNSPSTLWELYLLLGITQSCWEPLNTDATNTGTQYFTRRHQEGLSLLPHHLWTPSLPPEAAPLPQLVRFYFHRYQSWFIFPLVKCKVTFRSFTTHPAT